MLDTELWDGAIDHALHQVQPVSETTLTPGQLAQKLYPGATKQTSALRKIDQALQWAYERDAFGQFRREHGQGRRLIICMPPQEGKSTRVTTVGPVWVLTQNQELRIAVASYQQDLANEFGREIRNLIQSNNGIEETFDIGLRIARDNGAASSWRLEGKRGGVKSVGISSGLTGRPVDGLFIDDPISNMEQAESKVYRKRVWNWWLSVGGPRLAPGSPVVLILTRWHHDDLAGRLKAAEDGNVWKVLNIPAQWDKEPEHDGIDDCMRDIECGCLGREEGEYLDSARGRTDEEWEAIKKRSGPRVWNALYQGRPTVHKGGLFCDDWPEYEEPFWVVRADGSCFLPGALWPEYEVAQSWDMAFKDADESSYVVGQVWVRRGVHCYLAYQIRDHMTFNRTIEAIKAVTAMWPQAVQKFVEDKANGPAIMNALSKQIPGFIPIEPEGSKFARASAISPLSHSGNIVLPAPLRPDGSPLAPWVTDFKEECREFPNGAHDDQVDCMSQAVNRMLLMPLMEEGIIEPEEFTAHEHRGWHISPV